MADSGYACDDRKLPCPDCTCGVGNDAPTSAHRRRSTQRLLVREFVFFDPDCAIYTWAKGCKKVHARQCPDNQCRLLIAVCDSHGGDHEAVRRMVEHIKQHEQPVLQPA